MYSHNISTNPSSLTGGLYGVTKKSKASTIPAYTTLFHSKSFVRQSAWHRSGPPPGQKQFQTSFSDSNGTTLCHRKWGQRGVVCSWGATWLVMEHHWFTVMPLVRPSWNMTEAYFLCEVPLRKMCYLGVALVSLQASTADLPEGEFWRRAQCSMGAPSYLSHAKRTDLQANLLSTALVLWGNICPTHRESLWASQQLPAPSLSSSGACCNLPAELRASPSSNLDTGRGSPGEYLIT